MRDSLWQDLRYAFRSLARRPLVTTVAMLSLALGIGVNAALFSVFDRLLLRRLPVPAPEEIVNITSPGPRPGNLSTDDSGGSETVFSYPLFRDLERIQTPFSDIAAYRSVNLNLGYRGQTLSGEGLLVSGGYFSALRLTPTLGRPLRPDDDRDASDHGVAVLSHRYWTIRFGANPAVLNETLVVNGIPMTIVGVGPAGFDGTTTMEVENVFVPIRAAPRISRWRNLENRRDHWLHLLGRLKPGLSRAQAESALAPPFSSLIREVELPLQRSGLSARGRELFEARRMVLEEGARGSNDDDGGETATILTLLFAVTGFVLLIACANVANLLMSRAADRATEVAVRFSIGASRGRVLRLLLTEACLLGVLAGGGALLVARLSVAGLLRLLPVEDGALLEFEMSGAMLLFTGVLSLTASLLFGLLPALHAVHSHGSGSFGAQLGRSTSSRSASRVRASLAAAQIALATALLAQAGLFVVSLVNVARADLGIQRTGLSTFRVAPVLNGYAPPQALALFDRLEASLAGTPGVISVSASTIPLLSDTSRSDDVTVEGVEADPDADRQANLSQVGTNYFSTIGVPLRAGREFTLTDMREAPKVAIVNEAFVRKFSLGPNVLGRRMGTGSGQVTLDIEIVGLVADSAYRQAKEAPPAQFFLPYRQSLSGDLTFYVRSSPGSNPAAVMAAIPGIVRRFDPNVPVENLRTMDEQFDENTTTDRVLMTLSSAFAGLAMLLAGIGLYAVLAYAVSQRIREIGIRMALGARTLDVRWMVLAQVGRITIVGGIVGGAIAVGIGRLAQSMLFGLDGFDARILAGAAAVVIAVALAAGVLPARRATLVNPSEALRVDP